MFHVKQSLLFVNSLFHVKHCAENEDSPYSRLVIRQISATLFCNFYNLYPFRR